MKMEIIPADEPMKLGFKFPPETIGTGIMNPRIKESKMLDIDISDFPITPTFDNVFVIKDPAEKSESGAFYLPDSVKGRAQTGVVLAVGPGYLDLLTGKFIATTIKTGQHVFLKEFSGYIKSYTDAKGKEWKFFVFSEKEILGIVNE